MGYKHSYYPQTMRLELQIQTGGAEPLATSPFTPPRRNTRKGFLSSIKQKQSVLRDPTHFG